MQTFLDTDRRGWTRLRVHCPECNRTVQQAADLRKLKQRQKNDAVQEMDVRLRAFFRKSHPSCEHAKQADERW